MRKVVDRLGKGRLFQVGIRSGTEEEFKLARKMKSIISFDQVSLKSMVKRLRNEPVYISLDLDVIDPSLLPGVGTPEPGGLTFQELISLLKNLQPLHVIGFDMVELTPDYDPTQISSLTASVILREMILAFCFKLLSKRIENERKIPEKNFGIEKMETLSREEAEKIRLRRLRKQLKYCYTHSEFYKRKFDEFGFLPEDIKTWEDFRRIPPLMDKEDERQSQKESIERFGHPFGIHLCCPPEKIIVARTTGGTTGMPTFSYSFTQHDYHRWNEGISSGILAGRTPAWRSSPLLFSSKWRLGWKYRQISSPKYGDSLLRYRCRDPRRENCGICQDDSAQCVDVHPILCRGFH